VHCHLEGCIPAEVVQRAAGRGGRAAPDRGPYRDLGAFLAALDATCACITEPGEVTAIARDVGRSTAEDGVIYAEVIWNPGHWPAWKGAVADFLDALDVGFAAAEDDGGAAVGLCISIGRWCSAEEATELVEGVLAIGHPRVVGVSIDGDESAPGAGTDRFLPALNRARHAGLGIAVHAGESSGPEGVWSAIDLLGADRVDHGIRALNDPALLDALRDREIPLDICPSSNIALGLVPDLRQHPIERLRRHGVRVSVNTDDPVLFDTSLLDELAACASTFSWSRHVVGEVTRTAFLSTFAPEDAKRAYLTRLDRYLEES
jgi:adenosine deaminase